MFVGNWNAQGLHGIVVTGRQATGSGSNRIDQLYYIDPAMGMELPVNIGYFNAMMLNLGTAPENPIHFPANPPVRATWPATASG